MYLMAIEFPSPADRERPHTPDNAGDDSVQPTPPVEEKPATGEHAQQERPPQKGRKEHKRKKGEVEEPGKGENIDEYA